MSDPVTYSAMLPIAEETVLFVSRLLAAERRRRGTRSRQRALGCHRQAVLILRWFVDGTRLAQLAADNRIGRSTAYRTPPDGIAVPLRIRAGDDVLSFLSTVTTFDTVVDLTAAELTIEAFLPADPHTAEALRQLAP